MEDYAEHVVKLWALLKRELALLVISHTVEGKDGLSQNQGKLVGLGPPNPNPDRSRANA